jgi:hypothetical protein
MGIERDSSGGVHGEFEMRIVFLGNCFFREFEMRIVGGRAAGSGRCSAVLV